MSQPPQTLLEQLQQSAGKAPRVVISESASPPLVARSKFDMWKFALIVVFAAIATVVGVIIYNKSTEKSCNMNLVRLEDDEDWNDIDDEEPRDFEEQHKDPNFTLLRDIL